MGKIIIHTPSTEEANKLADALASPTNAWDVATSANNTVEIGLNEDTDAALELLAQLISARNSKGSGSNLF